MMNGNDQASRMRITVSVVENRKDAFRTIVAEAFPEQIPEPLAKVLARIAITIVEQNHLSKILCKELGKRLKRTWEKKGLIIDGFWFSDLIFKKAEEDKLSLQIDIERIKYGELIQLIKMMIPQKLSPFNKGDLSLMLDVMGEEIPNSTKDMIIARVINGLSPSFYDWCMSVTEFKDMISINSVRCLIQL